MKKLVIIGGGFAGTYIAKALESKFNTTLIDNKDYFEFTPSILKLAVNPVYKDKIRIPHSSYLKNTKIFVDRVKSLTDKEVILPGKKIKFDYLVISAGSSYGTAIKGNLGIKAGNSEELLKAHKLLVKSKNVLIIGGGLVGVELAGEITQSFPEKNITIIHSRDNLIERNHPKAIRYAEKFLKNRGVKMIFKERADIKNKNLCKIGSKEISCDLIYVCTGITPNYQFMKNFPSLTDERRQIKVNSFLQLERANMFAAGDINSINEEKTAQAAEKQAKVIVQNLLNLESNKPLKEYHGKKKAMVISLGKYNGIFEYKNLVLTGKIPALIKWFVEFKTLWKH